MMKTTTACLAWLIAAAGVPAVASGQNEPQPASVRRPYRGIFGAPADPTKQSLDLTFSLYGAYDDDVYAEQTGSTPLPDAVRQSGWFGGLNGGLSYNRPGDRLSLSAGGGAGMSFYANQNQNAPLYHANAGLGIKLPKRAQLSVSEGFVYAPEYRLGLFTSPTVPGQPLDPFTTVPPDYDVFKQQSYRTATDVSIGKPIGKHSTLSGFYALNQVFYADNSFDYSNQAGGFSFGQRLTRNANLHLGYSYSTANYTNVPGVINGPGVNSQGLHSIDAGVDYGRALSISRRTHFSFSTGSAILRSTSELESSGGGFSFHVVGSANLIHEIARSWTASLAYNRNVQFHEGFVQPLLSDGVTAQVNGLLTRRLSFDASAFYVLGTVGSGTDNRYHSTSAGTGLQYGLSKMLALYTRYVYYSYSFDDRAVIDPRFPQALDRQGVRFGLDVFVPLVR